MLQVVHFRLCISELVFMPLALPPPGPLQKMPTQASTSCLWIPSIVLAPRASLHLVLCLLPITLGSHFAPLDDLPITLLTSPLPAFTSFTLVKRKNNTGLIVKQVVEIMAHPMFNAHRDPSNTTSIYFNGTHWAEHTLWCAHEVSFISVHTLHSRWKGLLLICHVAWHFFEWMMLILFGCMINDQASSWSFIVGNICGAFLLNGRWRLI